MKILFLSHGNPNDKTLWSGSIYQMYAHLAKYHIVEWIGPIEFNHFEKLLLQIQFVFCKVFGLRFTSHNTLYSVLCAKRIQKRVNQSDCELIFAPAASELIAYLHPLKPIIYFSDTTFNLMIDYYPFFTGLHRLFISQGHAIERQSIHKAVHTIYSSDWAMDSAVQFYKADPNKISVLPFGANLSKIPTRNDLNCKPVKNFHILFLGVEWIRKGGQIAYDAFLLLKKRGISCTLTIIGCNPKNICQDKDLTIIPFLNKNVDEDAEQLYQIFLNTHLLLHPTYADCSAIVIAEAAAFGIPVVTRQTGGLGCLVKNGYNGFLLPYEANEYDFSNKMFDIFTNETDYENLRNNARQEYEDRLSWSRWIDGFNKIVSNLEKC